MQYGAWVIRQINVPNQEGTIMSRTECKTVATHIRQYSEAIETIEAAASLPLIQAVDLTIDSLIKTQKMLRPFVRMAASEAENISTCENGEAIDTDGAMAKQLLNIEENLIETCDTFKFKIEAAKSDRRLKDYNESDVVSEYNRTIDTMIALHDATRNLRWAIMEHDADLSGQTGEFDNVESLMGHLRAL